MGVSALVNIAEFLNVSIIPYFSQKETQSKSG